MKIEDKELETKVLSFIDELMNKDIEIMGTPQMMTPGFLANFMLFGNEKINNAVLDNIVGYGNAGRMVLAGFVMGVDDSVIKGLSLAGVKKITDFIKTSDTENVNMQKMYEEVVKRLKELHPGLDPQQEKSTEPVAEDKSLESFYGITLYDMDETIDMDIPDKVIPIMKGYERTDESYIVELKEAVNILLSSKEEVAPVLLTAILIKSPYLSHDPQGFVKYLINRLYTADPKLFYMMTFGFISSAANLRDKSPNMIFALNHLIEVNKSIIDDYKKTAQVKLSPLAVLWSILAVIMHEDDELSKHAFNTGSGYLGDGTVPVDELVKGLANIQHPNMVYIVSRFADHLVDEVKENNVTWKGESLEALITGVQNVLLDKYFITYQVYRSFKDKLMPGEYKAYMSDILDDILESFHKGVFSIRQMKFASNGNYDERIEKFLTQVVRDENRLDIVVEFLNFNQIEITDQVMLILEEHNEKGRYALAKFYADDRAGAVDTILDSMATDNSAEIGKTLDFLASTNTEDAAKLQTYIAAINKLKEIVSLDSLSGELNEKIQALQEKAEAARSDQREKMGLRGQDGISKVVTMAAMAAVGILALAAPALAADYSIEISIGGIIAAVLFIGMVYNIAKNFRKKMKKMDSIEAGKDPEVQITEMEESAKKGIFDRIEDTVDGVFDGVDKAMDFVDEIIDGVIEDEEADEESEESYRVDQIETPDPVTADPIEPAGIVSFFKNMFSGNKGKWIALIAAIPLVKWYVSILGSIGQIGSVSGDLGDEEENLIKAGEPVSDSPVIELTGENIDEFVIERSYEKPVLIDFYGQVCHACRELEPVYEKMAKELESEVIFARMDAHNNLDIARSFKVRSLPTLLLVINGKVVVYSTGVNPKKNDGSEIKENREYLQYIIDTGRHSLGVDEPVQLDPAIVKKDMKQDGKIIMPLIASMAAGLMLIIGNVIPALAKVDVPYWFPSETKVEQFEFDNVGWMLGWPVWMEVTLIVAVITGIGALLIAAVILIAKAKQRKEEAKEPKELRELKKYLDANGVKVESDNIDNLVDAVNKVNISKYLAEKEEDEMSLKRLADLGFDGSMEATHAVYSINGVIFLAYTHSDSMKEIIGYHAENTWLIADGSVVHITQDGQIALFSADKPYVAVLDAEKGMEYLNKLRIGKYEDPDQKNIRIPVEKIDYAGFDSINAGAQEVLTREGLVTESIKPVKPALAEGNVSMLVTVPDYDQKIKNLIGDNKDYKAYQWLLYENKDEVIRALKSLPVQGKDDYTSLVGALRQVAKNKELIKHISRTTPLGETGLEDMIKETLIANTDDKKVREFIRKEWDQFFRDGEYELQMQLFIDKIALEAEEHMKMDARELLILSQAEAAFVLLLAGAVSPYWALKLKQSNDHMNRIVTDGVMPALQTHMPEFFSAQGKADRISDFIHTNRNVLTDMGRGVHMVVDNDKGKEEKKNLRIDIGEQTHYNKSDDIVIVGIDTAERLVDLFMSSPEQAMEALTAIVLYERTRSDEDEGDINAFAKEMQKTLNMDRKQLTALIIWYDIYESGMTEDSGAITRYVGSMLKDHDLKEIIDIRDRVEKRNEMYLAGQKRIIDAQDRGMMGVDKARKVALFAGRLAARFAAIVKNLFNVTTTAPAMPSALLLNAVKDGSFARLSAYALGERKSKSVLDVLMEIARELDAAARGEKDGSIFDDMRDVRELIQAT
ncbi:thioredoxin family protein [Elusimicrobiota bacterium]